MSRPRKKPATLPDHKLNDLADQVPVRDALPSQLIEALEGSTEHLDHDDCLRLLALCQGLEALPAEKLADLIGAWSERASVVQHQELARSLNRYYLELR